MSGHFDFLVGWSESPQGLIKNNDDTRFRMPSKGNHVSIL